MSLKGFLKLTKLKIIIFCVFVILAYVSIYSGAREIILFFFALTMIFFAGGRGCFPDGHPISPELCYAIPLIFYLVLLYALACLCAKVIGGRKETEDNTLKNKKAGDNKETKDSKDSVKKLP